MDTSSETLAYFADSPYHLGRLAGTEVGYPSMVSYDRMELAISQMDYYVDVYTRATGLFWTTAHTRFFVDGIRNALAAQRTRRDWTGLSP